MAYTDRYCGSGEKAIHFSITVPSEPSALRWRFTFCHVTSASSMCGHAGPRPAFDEEDDVRAEVAVPADDHARRPLGDQRQVLRLGRECEPLLEGGPFGPVGVALAPNLLPRHVGVVDVAERRLEAVHLRR